METMAHFAGLLVTTVFAVVTAGALDWLLLNAMFHLMRPATARRPQVRRSEIVKATRELARHFAPQPKV
ncbi:MAG TPA: hypothetical protein VLX32_11885 [Candidatus Acidoferrum sp.]|nr:hypothetical protein [Candidatus Acidoferrum sp.]